MTQFETSLREVPIEAIPQLADACFDTLTGQRDGLDFLAAETVGHMERLYQGMELSFDDRSDRNTMSPEELDAIDALEVEFDHTAKVTAKAAMTALKATDFPNLNDYFRVLERVEDFTRAGYQAAFILSKALASGPAKEGIGV